MLQNKTVLITGSSSGIGAATAELAAQYGAKVILHGRNKSDYLEKLADGLHAPFITCDISKKTEVEVAVQGLIPKIKKIDVLINCAGMNNPKPFLETTDEDWLQLFQVNLLGMVHFCQTIIPHMLSAKYGRIVNIASIRSHYETTGPKNMTYSIAKSGVLNLTAALAKEYAPHITVNAVSPGFIETDMSKSWTETVWKQASTSLLNRTGKPKEIAEVILFLASERASFINGQTIIADGGYMISGK